MIHEKLKEIKIFQKLNDIELQEVMKMSVLKKFSKENILFYEGEVPQYFYVLLKGKVKCFKNDLKGKELVLHYFTKPILIAEMPSLEKIAFRATAIIMENKTEILLVDREKFITLLHENRESTFDMMQSLTQKMKELEVAINRNLIYDASTKVCSYILENPKSLVKNKQKEIASLLSMAPETLSRILRKLKKMGILDNQCQLINPYKLQALLDLN
jgi:CRP/FNR family transcriptional regulator